MEITVEAQVTKVTVYPDRARVTCQGRCELPEGLQQIVFPELPLALEPDSLRAGGRGAARVRIRSVEVSRTYYSETPSADVHELEQAIEKLRDEMRVLADRKAGQQAQLAHLDGLRQATTEYAWGLARGRTQVDDQAQLVAFFQAQDELVRAEIRAIATEERTLERELEKLEGELNHRRSARPRQRFQAQVEVEVLSVGAFEPEITYVVGQAAWQPLYDIRLQEESAGTGLSGPLLDVGYIAEITQSTGQPWTGVELIVSTARPALNQQLPELKPWYIDVLQVQPRLAKTAMAPAAAATMYDAAPAETALEAMAAISPAAISSARAEVAVAEAQDSGAAVSYKIPGRVDIPGDGDPHKTTIGRFEMTPRLDYFTAPRQADAAFRRATLVNAGSGPLLAGPANLFVGDEYIGRNRLDYTPTQGEVELLLGAEERLVVERELVRRDVDKRMLRDVRRLHYGYEIRLKNLLPAKADVVAQDNFPVSRNEQIKVRLEKAVPAPAEQTELNILEWRLQLEPGQEQKIRYEYSVEYPSALRVIGLID